MRRIAIKWSSQRPVRSVASGSICHEMPLDIDCPDPSLKSHQKYARSYSGSLSPFSREKDSTDAQHTATQNRSNDGSRPSTSCKNSGADPSSGVSTRDAQKVPLLRAF